MGILDDPGGMDFDRLNLPARLYLILFVGSERHACCPESLR